MHDQIINKIKEFAQPIVEETDMFLVDVEIKHQKVPEVWVLVDSEFGQVSLDKCSAISRKLSEELDAQDLLPGKYRLNVSSPGLSRPLSDKRQYGKNRGRTAAVKYKRQDNYHSVQGVIEKIDQDKILILQDNKDALEIRFDEIVETKIIPKI